MRAIVFYEHGGPEVLQYREDIAIPEPGPDEVLVRVRYAALNRLDDFVRTGWKGLNLAIPHILGADFSGEIAALGSAVSGWRVGQPVVANPTLWCGHCPACVAGDNDRCEQRGIMGEDRPGTYAEYASVPARNLVAIPDGFPLDVAAAAPLTTLTAWHMLVTRGSLRPGESVLVVGAGGGVNSVAIQIARFAGATVYVIASNGEKVHRARQLGADWAVDRSSEPNWSKAVWNKTARRGVDVVVDNVGESTWVSSLRSLRQGGRLLTVGGTTGYNAVTPVNLIFNRQLAIIGSNMGTQSEFETAMSLVWSGQLKPVVDRVYPLSAYPAALARMLSGEEFGKIVLRIE